MASQPSKPAAARVTTPSGLVLGIPEGGRLVFGRGPDADLTIAAGRGLSRRAGVISAVADGAWVANISHTHALYAEGDGYRVRLPRMDEAGEGRRCASSWPRPAAALAARPTLPGPTGTRPCCRFTWTRTPSSSSWRCCGAGRGWSTLR